jgi:hypothetical protein
LVNNVKPRCYIYTAVSKGPSTRIQPGVLQRFREKCLIIKFIDQKSCDAFNSNAEKRAGANLDHWFYTKKSKLDIETMLARAS